MSSESSSSSGSDNSDVIAYEVEAIRGKRIRWGGVRIIPFSRSISIEFSQTVQNSAISFTQKEKPFFWEVWTKKKFVPIMG